jgi:spore coat polysaccharide biosynthesis predicted glycosyltransferase SpsG
MEFELNFRILVFTNDIFYADERFTFLEIGTKLDYYLSEADIVFTTCGTSVWEFLYLNIPMGFALATQNQSRNHQILSTTEKNISIGFFDNKLGWRLSSEKILTTIVESDKCSLNETLVDGFGVRRIYDEIIKRQICN